MTGRPYIQFYPGDWRKDAELQSCSIAARGLWLEMLCIAHQCEPYGHLSVKGSPMTHKQIARLAGVTEREFERHYSELLRARVFSELRDSTIYSRRMARDEVEREKWRDRQAKSRSASRDSHGQCHAEVTPESRRTSLSLSESESELPSEVTPRSPRGSVKVKAREPFVLPDWVPPERWLEFVEMRRKIRAPLTEAAMRLAVRNLEKLKESGHLPAAVLEQSVVNSWRGLFETKAQTNSNGSGIVMTPQQMASRDELIRLDEIEREARRKAGIGVH